MSLARRKGCAKTHARLRRHEPIDAGPLLNAPDARSAGAHGILDQAFEGRHVANNELAAIAVDNARLV